MAKMSPKRSLGGSHHPVSFLSEKRVQTARPDLVAPAAFRFGTAKSRLEAGRLHFQDPSPPGSPLVGVFTD